MPVEKKIDIGIIKIPPYSITNVKKKSITASIKN